MVHIKAIIVFLATTLALTKMPKFAGSSSGISDSRMPTILRLILKDAAKGATKCMENLFRQETTGPDTLQKHEAVISGLTQPT